MNKLAKGMVITTSDTIETILEKLVRIPTVTGDAPANYEAIAYIEDFLRARGMSVCLYEYEGHRSLVATVRPNEKRPLLMLYAHIDVVPAGEQLWKLQKRDGRYYGRGVFDMKFSLAVYLALIDELADELHDYDLGIMVVSDEENGGAHGVGHLASLGYRPTVCVIPDGGEGWNIEVYAKGYLRLVIEAHGVSAHGSRPWEGENALVGLMSLLHEVEALFPDNMNPDANTINIGYLKGGHHLNQIPAHAEAGIDIRFISPEDEVALMRAIEAVCGRHNATLAMRGRGGAVQTDLANPYVKAFAETITQVTGRKPQPHRAHGATDAAFFADMGTICIISVPDAGGRHADGEWIDVQGVDQYKEVLKEYLAAIAKMSPVQEAA